MDTSDYDWLVSDAARTWLARAAESTEVSVRSIQTLRKDLSSERARLVIEQVELRRRAREKFRHAERMFFTRRSLEQATDDVLAEIKAQRFPPNSSVVDLCCGIGGDLLAIAGRGPALGVELDPVHALFARANVRALAGGGADVRLADARDVDLMCFDGWHADPDRRAQGRRVTRVGLFEPDVAALESWLRTARSGGIKLAPATDWGAVHGELLEREWLGSRGECRQQMIWSEAAARHPGRRSVTVCERGWPTASLVESSEAAVADAGGLGRFVFETHAAVLAAGLTASLAAQRNLQTFPGVQGYLTGDEPQVDALLDCYEVVEQMPFDRRRVKQWLNERGVGRVVVKKRGMHLDLAQLERQWTGRGDRAITLLITRWGDSAIAIAAHVWRPFAALPGQPSRDAVPAVRHGRSPQVAEGEAAPPSEPGNPDH